MATIKLFESWLKENVLNELGPSGGIDLAKLVFPSETFKDIQDDESYNFFYEEIKVILKKNGIIFSCPVETAAAIIAWNSLQHAGKNESGPGLAWLKQLAGTSPVIKLMDGPQDSSKVLTTGYFMPDKIEEPADDSMESNYTDIALFCNNSSLLSLLDPSSNYTYELYLPAEGTGSLKWKKIDGGDSWIRLYGTAATTSAVSKQAIKTTTWTVPAEGKTLVKNLPGSMFATGAATLADSKDLDSAIAELTALTADKNTKITKIEIQSSSSGDRGIGGVSGYPKGSAAGAFPLGKPYLPKAAAESANAKLAFDRAATIQSKLAALNVPTSVKAMIQDGGDAAQFAKLIVTIEMADKPSQTLTKQDLDNLLLKPKGVTDLGSTKVLSRWAVRNFKM